MQPQGIYNIKNTLYTDVVQKTALIHETYTLSLKQPAVTGIPQDVTCHYVKPLHADFSKCTSSTMI